MIKTGMLASTQALQLLQKLPGHTPCCSPALRRRHFPLVVAYKSPSSVDLGPPLHPLRPPFSRLKTPFQTGYVSAFSQNDVHLITCSLLQHTLHIHLFLAQKSRSGRHVSASSKKTRHESGMFLSSAIPQSGTTTKIYTRAR